MPKLPWMKFFPADYLLDTQLLTASARGAWMDLICHLWRSPTRGTLTLSDPQWAVLLRVEPMDVTRIFEELKRNGICNIVTVGDGAVTVESRRITKEENARNGAAKRMRAYRDRRNSDGVVTAEKLESEARSQKLEARNKKKNTEGTPSRAIGLVGLEQFQIDEEMNAWAKRELIPSPDAYLAEFKDYWQSVGGKRKTGPVKDWPATFRNYLRMLRDNGRLKGARDKRQAGTCAYRVKKDSFLKPCGEPAELIGGHYLCDEHRSMKHERPHITAT